MDACSLPHAIERDLQRCDQEEEERWRLARVGGSIGEDTEHTASGAGGEKISAESKIIFFKYINVYKHLKHTKTVAQSKFQKYVYGLGVYLERYSSHS